MSLLDRQADPLLTEDGDATVEDVTDPDQFPPVRLLVQHPGDGTNISDHLMFDESISIYFYHVLSQQMFRV